MYNPPHPGEILREYVEETNKTITEVAQGIGINRKNLSLILNGHAGISAEMAIRLGTAFGTTPEFWIIYRSNTTCGKRNKKLMCLKYGTF
jgi:addiction module HigA family antidote